MDLLFDQGTLLIKSSNPKLFPPKDSLIRWDERINAFRALGHSYPQICNRLNSIQANYKDHISSSFLKPNDWIPPQLRPYQGLALEIWKRQSQRGIICIPTGSGKTLTAIGAMAQSKCSTLCVVPTLVLMHQWVETIRSFYNGPIGLLGDGNSSIEAITVSTFESAYRKMSDIGHHFELLIIDEVHHFGNGARSELMQMSVSPKRLGLTATPPTSPETSATLEHLIGPIVFQLGVKDLIGTWLAPFNHFCLRLELTPSERNQYQTLWQQYAKYRQWYQKSCPEGSWNDFIQTAKKSEEGRKALNCRRDALSLVHFSEAKQATLASILKRHNRQKCLIFTADTASAIAISTIFLLPVITGDIKKGERDHIVKSFREGTIRCIIACRVLNEGFDVCDAEVAIIVGGAHGSREHIQRLGRILRPAQDKNAILYELIARNTCEEFKAKSRNESVDGIPHE